MITPCDNTEELEYRLLYSMVVAGKSASFAEGAINRFLHPEKSPFAWVRELEERGQLLSELRNARTGNYGKLSKGFASVAAAGLDLRTVTSESLEAFYGIGPKTARFFILWTRPNAHVAALDTHILKWLRFVGHSAPISTPTGKEYERLESVFLMEAKARKMPPRELDALIWDWCSGGHHKNGAWPKKLQPIKP